ncbi:hypothetical protein PALB_37550 [Pseudoalteromonas luteoviolacea B = ATCC 29581]|nr:hypothetical protein PALB_37550 [Pseudoalteromonas luteoviolacea B = ATCC 29581]
MLNYYHASIIVIFLLPALFGCASQQQDSEFKCKTTIERYMALRDNGPTKDYQALFVEQAEFNIPQLNINVSGSKAIANRQAIALKETQTMHILTHSSVKHLSNNEFEAESIFVLLQKSKQDNFDSKVIYNGRYNDLMVLHNDQCLFKRRTVHIIGKQEW